MVKTKDILSVYMKSCMFSAFMLLCISFSVLQTSAFFNTIRALNASSKLFWKTLHIMKQSFEDVSA